MPLYDPVRDPNPSPSREKAPELYAGAEHQDVQALRPDLGGRSFSSSSRTSVGEASASGDGAMSPVRSRASIADILNPTPPPDKPPRLDIGLGRPSLQLGGPLTAPVQGSGDIAFGSPFAAYAHLPPSAGGYGRQERSPSLANILNGGEAGPIERGTPKSRSSSISNSRAPSLSVPATSSPDLTAGASSERVNDSPRGRFATLLHSASSQSSHSAGPSAPGLSPGLPVPPVIHGVRLGESGRSLSSEGKTRDGFAVPEVPASRSPDVGRNTAQLPEVSSLRAAAPAMVSPTTSVQSVDSGSAAAPAPKPQPAAPAEAPSSPALSGSSTADAAAPAKPARRKSTTAGVRRKHSMIVADEDLVPVGADASAIVAAAEREEARAPKKVRKATPEHAEAKAAEATPRPAQPDAGAQRSSPAPGADRSEKSKELATSSDPAKAASRLRYAPPQRVSRPDSVLVPISPAEIESFKRRHQNPLRRMAEAAAQGTKLANGVAASTEEVGEVARHYNARADVGIQGREQSRIAPMRKFNNWVKSVLIGRFARERPDDAEKADGERDRRRPRGPRVLELGCGKGGDLQKWDKARASHLVMIDIADVSIQQAQDRFYGKKNHSFTADFFAFDCFGIPLAEKLPPDVLEPKFDNLSLQFCMHYAWSDVPKVRILLENISKYLRKGGIFIGTTPDGDALRRRLQALPEGQLKWGNSIYSVEFEQRDSFPIFGHKYNFFLDDAVENVPEYVVDWTQFESLAFEYGMKNIYHKNFLQVYEDERSHPEFERLLRVMGVIDGQTQQPLLDEEMWDAVSIYQAFAFEKIR